MSKADAYNELILQLGDLARERLASRPRALRSLDRVHRAEEAVVRQRQEMEDLEQQMNDVDQAYRDYLAAADAERERQRAIVKKWKKVVDGVEKYTRDLRRKLSGLRATAELEQRSLAKAEERQRDLELENNPAKVAAARETVKKLRLTQMRLDKEMRELEAELAQSLTPQPGQPGAEGILAHKRLIELDDEAVAKKAEYEAAMADLEAAIAAKEEELHAAEDFLDQATFLLGEECYAQRLDEPVLAALYPKLDRLR